MSLKLIQPNKMFLITFTVLIIAVNAKVVIHNVPEPNIDFNELAQIWTQSSNEDLGNRILESIYPGFNRRIRRDVEFKGGRKIDGNSVVDVKIPIGDQNKDDPFKASVVGGIVGDHNNNGGYKAASAGLLLENTAKGHAVSLGGEHIPGFGDKLTVGGKVNILKTPDHDLSLNSFKTLNRPTIHNVPDFQSHGASLDYSYKDNKFGGSLGMTQNDFNQRTYSAMAHANVYKTPVSSLDFSGGFSKFSSPHYSSSLQPSFAMTYARSF